jgi:glucokinase
MAGSHYYVGIDLGGTNIQAGIVTAMGKVVVRGSVKTKAEQGAAAVVSRITALVEQLTAEAKIKPASIEAVGIGAPGAVDTVHGKVLTAVNLRWNNYPLAQVLRKQLKKPVVVDNDVNVGTWGEHIAGAGKGHSDMFGIFVGTGIGGGLVLGGKLYRGTHLSAGEIGHTIVEAGSGLGRRTVENLASRTAIVNLLNQLMAASHSSVLADLSDGEGTKIRSKVLAQAMRQRDPLTREVIGQAARYVGISIANTVTLLSLPCVVVGGGVTEALRKPWIDLVRQSFNEYVFPPTLKKCRIVMSALGDDAGVVGAALLAREGGNAR